MTYCSNYEPTPTPMKTYNVPESFILEAHKEACDKWKKKIEGIAPDLFKSKFKVGDWLKYIGCNDWFGHPTSVFRFARFSREYCYVNSDSWNSREDSNHYIENFRLATKEEIEKHLIAEAEKRGFKEGVYINRYCFSCFDGFRGVTKYQKDLIRDDRFSYFDTTDSLGLSGYTIYREGTWATILPSEKVRLTLEDIAELKGVDVSLIEIVK